MLTNPPSSIALITSSFTLLSLAEDKEEEEDEEWMVSMLISPSFCFGDSNLRVENEETNPVPKEELRRERSEVVESWEGREGRDPYGSSMEKTRLLYVPKSERLSLWLPFPDCPVGA